MEALGSFGGKHTNRLFAAHQHARSLGHDEEVLTKSFLQPSSLLTTLNKPPPWAGQKMNPGSKVGSGIYIRRMHNKTIIPLYFFIFFGLFFLFVMYCTDVHSELITAEPQLSPKRAKCHDMILWYHSDYDISKSEPA